MPFKSQDSKNYYLSRYDNLEILYVSIWFLKRQKIRIQG